MLACHWFGVGDGTSVSERGRKGKKPPRKLDEEKLYTYAVRALTRRPQSTAELRRALEKRAEEPRFVSRVIAQLKGFGYLDDRRFALQFASYRSRVKHYGKFRVTRELRSKGLPDEQVEAAIAEVFGGQDETEAVRERIRRKLRNARRPYDWKTIRRLYQALLRAGYSSDIIASELFKLRKISVEELNSEGEASE